MGDSPPDVAVTVSARSCGSADGVVCTRRLVLVPMSCELMRLVMAKEWAATTRLLGTSFPHEWRQDGWDWLAPRVAEGEHDPRLLGWATRLARMADADGLGSGPVVAEAGFHGPPDSEGWVEIGYRVVADRRRRGFATEAASALLGWAVERGVTGVKASVSPENAASSNLLLTLGFTEAGSYRHDVLGEQRIFRRGTRQEF